jgi:hypothetical protein
MGAKNPGAHRTPGLNHLTESPLLSHSRTSALTPFPYTHCFLRKYPNSSAPTANISPNAQA